MSDGSIFQRLNESVRAGKCYSRSRQEVGCRSTEAWRRVEGGGGWDMNPGKRCTDLVWLVVAQCRVTNRLHLYFKYQNLAVGPVVKNSPVNAGDTGSIPGPGRFHIPWSNY